MRTRRPNIPIFIYFMYRDFRKNGKKNTELKVYQPMENNKIKLSQYADGTQLILDGTEKTLKAALNFLNNFT